MASSFRWVCWAARSVRNEKVVIAGAMTVCLFLLPMISTQAQAPADARSSAAIAPAPAAVQQDPQRLAAIIRVKNALLAVNQGNLTGNYTVLRDLSSPGFREKNSAADLATIFQGVRQQKFDLSSIVVLDPVLNQPRISQDGQLMLDGYFSTQQVRINFQLAFLKATNGAWQIHGVSLNAAPELAAVQPIQGR